MSRWKRQKQKEKRRERGNGSRLVLDERSVSILVPHDDDVKSHFCFSLAQMVQFTILKQPPNLAQINILNYSTSLLPMGRQRLVETALELGATHTLWIDSDMMFPPDTMLYFLKTDHPIVGINATSRRPPFRNTAQVENRLELVTHPGSTGVEKVHRMGFGVLWIASEVYRAMQRPYFDFEWVEEFGTFRGEDYVFFEKARAAGYDFYVDHDLSKRVQHVGAFGFNPLLMANIQERERAAMNA